MLVHHFWRAALATLFISQASAVTHWFSFGDSYTETGFDPNGRQPSLAYPLGNTNQHPSGFLNYVWYLTRSLNGTTVLNYNLARSGAFVSKNVTPSNGFDDLEDEVSWWQGNYTGSDRKERWHANDTVASFWFGVNDITIGWEQHKKIPSYIPPIMKEYRRRIEQVHAQGVRKFLIINAPNVTRTPAVVKGKYSQARKEEHARMTTTFNEGVSAMVEDLQRVYLDSIFVVYRSFDFMNRILDDPRKYGFKDGLCDCGDKPGPQKECVWRNTLHPGREFNLLQARDMAEHLGALGL